jgi:hypothetical protein
MFVRLVTTARGESVARQNAAARFANERRAQMGFLDRLLGRDKPASTGDAHAHDHDHDHDHDHPPAPAASMPEAGTPTEDPAPGGGTTTAP